MQSFFSGLASARTQASEAMHSAAAQVSARIREHAASQGGVGEDSDVSPVKGSRGTRQSEDAFEEEKHGRSGSNEFELLDEADADISKKSKSNRLKQTGARVKNGVKSLLKRPKKRKADSQDDDDDADLDEEEFEDLEPQHVELMDPVKAPNSILRVLLLSAKQQLDSSHLGSANQHAVQLLNCLASTKKIQRDKLQQLAFFGISDEIKGLRPLIWRILLNYLPEDSSEWEDTLRQKKQIYELWKDELIVKPKLRPEDQIEDKKDAKIEQPKKISKSDHPLSLQSSSKWKQFYDDKLLWEEIEKDVKRTRVEMAFFMMAVDPDRNKAEDVERLEMQSHTKKSDLSRDDIQNYIESHSDALARVLFIYAQLNKGIKYVQGMNEILAVLYYCFWKSGNEAVISTEYLESDLFFCFSNLMSEIQDGFMRDLDKESSGIDGKCKAFNEVLRLVDPEVHEKLEEERVNPQFYSLRWLMLLLCQEFDMPSGIRLWDTLFADENRYEFLDYICVAIVQQVRDIIIEGDFAACMESLQGQTKQVNDIPDLIKKAGQVRIIYFKNLRIEKKKEKMGQL